MEGILKLVIAGLLFLVALKLLALKLNAGKTSSIRGLGYRQKQTLFTPAERSFLGVLDQVIDKQQYRVFGKVRVADLIEPNPSCNRSQWQKAFNAISAKHFDFVICTADTLSPVCVIELDDKSHNQKHRQQRDELLDSVCVDAGLPLIRIPAKRAYHLKEVNAALSGHFGAGEAVLAGGENVAPQLLGKASPEQVSKYQKLSESLTAESTELQVEKIRETVR
ncbi:DUF2726 domain-containing protein [Neptuniibacter sp. CAU 1671]|uniref:DUF2726 domain-containing protein n=1 Tax=Neptuniibacter sp. CAU 1671 TaxID=3032593 RepID=UPI0023DB3D48|nr:DUF2726 domain-containing protein [Neptuniibacter sp. CAU 1671]MDF2181880.1 DUF2726 domain-containing protein [Neptuniibacter sp. CAU 1671]